MDTFGLSAAQIDSAGAHWTAREILQQPQVWAEIDGLITADAARIAGFLRTLLQRPELRIVLTGAGTSGFIGECLAPALLKTLRRRVDAIPTTDLVSSPDSYLSPGTPTLLVSFARSGDSPESIAAVEVTEACVEQCHHLIFTCNAGGALYKQAGNSARALAILLPAATNDRSFAMTSSFTGMLLAAAAAFGAVPVGGARTRALAHLATQILPQRAPVLRHLVGEHFERIVYLGSKELKALSKEAALKMLELTDGKVVSVADSPLAFRHGPKTILTGKTLVVVFVSNDDYTRQYDIDLIGELRRDAVAGRVIALAARPGVPQHPDNVVLDNSGESVTSDLELCLPYAAFAQSLAMLCSLSLGFRPDHPNAAGTVNRVVQGVSIHPWHAV
jgi:tagatose-6-phosphate ketose/aldose isomerase